MAYDTIRLGLGYYLKQNSAGDVFKYDNTEISRIREDYPILLDILVKKKGNKWCNNIFNAWYVNVEYYYKDKKDKKESLMDFISRTLSELDYNHMEIEEESLLLAISDIYEMVFIPDKEIRAIIENRYYERNGIKYDIKVENSDKRTGSQVDDYYISARRREVSELTDRLYIGSREYKQLVCVSCEFISLEMIDTLIDEYEKKQVLYLYRDWKATKEKEITESGSTFVDMLEKKDIREDFARFACLGQTPDFHEIWKLENYLMAREEKWDYVQTVGLR